MDERIIPVFRLINADATWNDVHNACTRLFLDSVQYSRAAVDQPFDPDEVRAVSDAILAYVVCPQNPTNKLILFKVPRNLEGSALEYSEFAAMFSEDMLYESVSNDLAGLDSKSVRNALEKFLVAILYRYQFCIFVDSSCFPMTMLLRFMDGVEVLYNLEGRSEEITVALWKLLRFLGSMEESLDVW